MKSDCSGKRHAVSTSHLSRDVAIDDHGQLGKSRSEGDGDSLMYYCKEQRK